MKKYKVTAELDLCAERYESVIVEANTPKKAIKFAEEEFRKRGAFFATNITVKLIER